MELNEYQDRAMRTCMNTCNNPLYMLGLLHEEAGELQGKFNKALRKGKIKYNEHHQMVYAGTFEEQMEFEQECCKELGDIMWAVAGIAAVFDWRLDGVGYGNLMKLASRQNRGVIDGQGDNR